ncbi:Tetratricopeptide repeat-containing protein [Candidatus Electrothrix gigas]
MSISSTFKKHGRWKGCLVILLYLLLSLLELFVVSLYLLFRFAQDTYRKMAKKRSQKKRRKSRAKSIAQFSIKELPNAGQNYLKQGKFAEAIKVFRRLVQESQDEKWREPLRSSFQGRINQLTAKGMHKEALVIFHNMETLFPDQDPELQGLHILLLIHADQPDKARQLYEQAEDTLPKQQKQLIDETFAALLLSGNEKFVQNFPADSPLRNQFFDAQQALRCYSQGQDSEVLKHLQALPFRSPYKNFRMALNGMLAFHENQKKAQTFFDKIHAKSPFFSLISPYLYILNDANDAEGREDERKDYSKTESKTEKKAVQQLQGLDRNKIKLLASLQRNATTPVGFIRCLCNTGAEACLDKKLLKQVCYQLLPHELSCLRMYEKRFGLIKDEFEQARLEALALEIKEESYNIPERWQQACRILSNRKNPDDALKIALMHRHIAAWIGRIHGEHSWKEQKQELEKSLDYDPDDKATWLKIHQLLSGSPAEQYRWVNRMLKQFPQEPEVLFLGTEAAIGRSAFKKASRLAGALLKIDPINTKVRELLINAHINHAHKLAKQEKYALACKECDHASAFGRGNADQGRIEITRGLLELLQGREKEGQALLDNGESQYEHSAVARVQVCMNAELLPISPAWKKKFTTRLKAAVKKKPEREELLQIIPQLFDGKGNKLPAWKSVRGVLQAYLKKGADLSLHKDEFVMLCQAWQRLHEFALLHAYGKKAAQHWPDIPLFTYYFVVGKSENGRKRLTDKDIEELEDASDMAMRQKDSATERLIDDFLDEHAFGFPEGPPVGILAELLKKEIFDNDEEGRKPTEEEIEKFFELFGDP